MCQTVYLHVVYVTRILQLIFQATLIITLGQPTTIKQVRRSIVVHATIKLFNKSVDRVWIQLLLIRNSVYCRVE